MLKPRRTNGGSWSRLSVILLILSFIKAAWSDIELCEFNDYDYSTSRCKVQLTGAVKWKIAIKAKDVRGDYLPKIDGDNSTDGSYAYIQMDDTMSPGAQATIDLPLLGKDDNAKCLKVSYVYFGELLATLQLMRTCGDDSTTMPEDARGNHVIWQLDGTTVQPQDWQFPWSQIEIPLYHDNDIPLDMCTLSLVVRASDARFHGAIALDNIIAGTCSWLKPDMCTFNEPCQHWEMDNHWKIEIPLAVSAIPFDHTYRSMEGKFLAMTTPDLGSCTSAKLTGIRLGDLLAPSACLTFVANAFNLESANDQIAEFYLHIVNGSKKISTPWLSKLFGLEKFTWSKMYAFIDVNDAVGLLTPETSEFRFVLEARYCSEKGRGGIAIDCLTALNYSISHCRRQGDDDFQSPTNTFWEPIDVDTLFYNWVILPSSVTKFNDHTFTEDKSRGQMLISGRDPSSVSRMMSSATLAPTHARCVTFFMYNIPNDGLKAFIRRIHMSDETILIWNYSPSLPNDMNRWQVASFSYFTDHFHRIIFEASGQVAIDDITFTDGLCACKPADSTNCVVPHLDKPTRLPGELTTYFSRYGDCSANVPTLQGGLLLDVPLRECARHCDTYPNSGCRAFLFLEATRECQLKAASCQSLTATIDKRFYERKQLDNYYAQPGECQDIPIATFTGKTTAQSCAEECTANTGCATFVYGATESMCWLHSSCKDRKAAEDRQSYEMIDFGGYYMYAGGCKDPGVAITQTGIPRRKCVQQCDEDLLCDAIVYTASKQQCTHMQAKSCMAHHVPMPDSITYVKKGIQGYSCDFENFDNCTQNGWQIGQSNSTYQFAVVSSLDGYAFGGPKRDTTLATDLQGSYLLLTYAATDLDDGVTPTFLKTPFFDPKVASCLSFRYYLFGPSVGAIEIHISKSETEPNPPLLYKVEHSKSDRWEEARINLAQMDTKASYQLIFTSPRNKDAYIGALAIDDVYVAPHDCFPTPELSCHFEGYDSCNATTLNGFHLEQGATHSIPDQTYNSGFGHYMHTDSLVNEAVFGFDHDAKFERCVTFWYRRASPCVTLRAGLETPVFKHTELVTSKKLDVEPWNQASVHLPGGFGSFEAQVIFRAEANDCDVPQNMWILLDDIFVLDHGCSRKTTCNFDSNYQQCRFTTDQVMPILMPWLFGQSDALTRIATPPKDNTLMSDTLGGFAFLDQISRGGMPRIAGIQTSWTPTLSDCITVTFYYSLTGPESGLLEVWVAFRSNPDAYFPKWNLIGLDRDSSWKFGRFSFPVYKPDYYRLYFRGTRGTNSYALLAIDDLVVMPGMRGGLYPPSADPKFPPTTPNPLVTTTPVTPYPTFPPQELTFSCDFEVDNCYLYPQGFALVCNEAGNCSKPAGRFLDHTKGTVDGMYMYVDLQQGKKADMGRNYQFEDGEVCLSYWYISTSGNEGYSLASGYSGAASSFQTWNIFSRKGPQSDQWQYVEHYLPKGFHNYARIGADPGKDRSGIVAIDDIQIAIRGCPPRENECNFDASYPTKFQCDSVLASSTTDAEWKVSERKEKGDVEDHTLQTSFGRYAYVSTNNNWTSSFAGVNISISFNAPSFPETYCLSFWYRLGGSQPGTLQVYQGETLIVSPLPYDSDTWVIAQGDVTVGGGGKWSATFVAGFEYPGNPAEGQVIHLDDIKVLKQPCNNSEIPSKCTFEKGQCGWKNKAAGVGPQFDWLLGTGYFGGPIPHDHTKDRSDGHYMFLPINPPLVRGSRARLVGREPFKGVNCLHFAFYIKASLTSKYQTGLRVLGVTMDTEVSFWYADFETWGQWSTATVPIDGLEKPYEIVFESYFDADRYDTLIGIDDIHVVSESCDRSPPGDQTDPSRPTTPWLTCSLDSEFCQWLPMSLQIPFRDWVIKNDLLDGAPAATVTYSAIFYDFSKRLESRWLATGSMSTVYCLTFSYAFHGLNPGMFSVAYRNKFNNKPEPIFTRTGSQGFRYQNAYVELSSATDFQLLFEATELFMYDADVDDYYPVFEVPYYGTLSIRDVVATDSLCSETVTDICDFEANRCTNTLMPMDYESSEVWQIMTPGDISAHLPPYDHSTMTRNGFFYGVVAKNANLKNGSYFLTQADPKNTTADQCLRFWYWLERGTLFIGMTYFSGEEAKDTDVVWQTSGDSFRWRLATATVRPKAGFNGVAPYIAVSVDYDNARIAIDDLEILDGTCPHSMECDFEAGLCSYELYPVYQGSITELSWIWVSAAHPDGRSFEGPLVDHTTETAFGHYLLINAKLLDIRTTVRMKSMAASAYPPGTVPCIDFWYMIKADNMELNVSIIIDKIETSSIVVRGDTKGAWQTARIESHYMFIEKAKWVQLKFDATKKDEGFDGFIAVDDIVYHAECYLPAPTTTPVPRGYFGTCDFDEDFCDWNNDPKADIAFVRTNGRVSSGNGPSSDVSGTGSYVYISSPNGDVEAPIRNVTARLVVGPWVDGKDAEACMQFYYYMTGPQVETLRLIDRKEADGTTTWTDTTIWSRSRSQGDLWKLGHVQINILGLHQFVFEATVTSGRKGVIAIDEIKTTLGACKHPEICDFEGEDFCGWYNDPEATASWTKVHGYDYPQNGPFEDHTYGTDEGAYLHFSLDIYKTYTAILSSPEYRLVDDEGCLHLWLETETVTPSLFVYLVPISNGIDMDNQKIAIFQFSDYEISMVFRRISAPLRYSGTFRLKLQSVANSEGGISIDDVAVNLHQSCGGVASCDFENAACGWQNVAHNKLDWQLHRGATETPGTGPRVDHTLGTAEGSYFLFESSTFVAMSTFQSEVISPYQFSNGKACFRFWYHMWGPSQGMGTLEVSIPSTNVKLWNITGNQGNEWKRVLVNVDTSGPLPIILQFKGTIGVRGQSDMAIDDTVLLPGDCSQYDDPVAPQFFECKSTNPDGSPVTIPLRKRCDLVSDCPIFGDDEVDCGWSCNFDDSLEKCAWEAIPRYSQQWRLGHGNEHNSLGPESDATQSSELGGYYFIDVDKTATTKGHAELLLHVPPTPASCKLQFYYILPQKPNSGELSVSIQLGDDLFDIFYENAASDPKILRHEWIVPLSSSTKAIALGRIHSEFSLIIRGRKLEALQDFMAIDGINLTDCMFPVPSLIPCSEQEFTCERTGSCIPRDKFCDLIDDCGDGSDESDCSSSPVYCNFEKDSCDFITYPKSSGKWVRRREIRGDRNAPTRDHTTGLNYGYYFYTNENGKASMFRLPKVYYIPQGSDCVLSFAIASPYNDFFNNTPLAVLATMEKDSTSVSFPITDFAFEEFDEWRVVRVSLSAGIEPNAAFEIYIIASNYTKYLALDDIVLSSGCRVDNDQVCLPPDYYRCKTPTGTTNQDCISSSLFGDYINDCPYGDDELGYGPCSFDPPAGSKESSLCKWTMSADDIFDNVQLPQAGSFAPTTDGPPTLNGNGWLLLARTKTIRATDDFTLTSPTLPKMSSRCTFRFAFYIYGSNNSEYVDVQVLQTDRMSLIETQSFLPNPNWQTSNWFNIGKNLYFQKSPKLSIRLKTSFNPLTAAVGIDNIEFSPECSELRCLPDIDCTFNEETLCRWLHSSLLKDELEWTFGDGRQVMALGGPGGDYDGQGHGSFLFISDKWLHRSFPEGTYGSTAEIRSPEYQIVKDIYCLQFAYNMFGTNPGHLRLLICFGESCNVTFSRGVSQGNQWHPVQVTIEPGSYKTVSKTYSLKIEASVMTSMRGFIAIDAIKATRGLCSQHTACDFEDQHQCGWSSTNTEPWDFAWERKNNENDYAMIRVTGPNQDHTTETYHGHYMYINSLIVSPGARALMKSVPYPIPNGPAAVSSFRFWYHMFGEDIATLSVTIRPKRARRNGFTRTGDHGNHWWASCMEISPNDFAAADRSGNFTINIEASRGPGWRGNIAVDDVSLEDGPCSAPATCDFENGQCGFSNVYELSKSAWLRNNGNTPSDFTGPGVDSSGDPMGYYMFVDSSKEASKIDKLSYFGSEIIQGSLDGHCLTFFYHMNGSLVGTLMVQLLYPNFGAWKTETIWSKSGSLGNDWLSSKISIATDQEYVVVFVADITKSASGGGGQGDIAIDNISLDQSGYCQGVPPPPPTSSPQQFISCGFENSNCVWQVDDPQLGIGWQRASGGLMIAEDAPINDHTRLDQGGHYLATWFNATDSPEYQDKHVILYVYSPYFATTQRHCVFGFYYYIGEKIHPRQRLEVGTLQRGAKDPDKLWNFGSTLKSTKQQWLAVKFDIGQQWKPFRIYIKHEIDSAREDLGTIAFDDISYLDCTSPAPSQDGCGNYEFHCENNVCVSQDFVCDGYDHCGDGTDESSEYCQDLVVVNFENGERDQTLISNVKSDKTNPDGPTIDWSFQRGATFPTGPRADHTFGNSSGNYYAVNLYFGTPNAKAWLLTKPFSMPKANCEMRFYYYMAGENVGSLTIYYRTSANGPLIKIWQRSGNVASIWLRATVDLTTSIGQDFEIVIEGQIGSDSNSDHKIGFDDVSFTEGCTLRSGPLPTITTTPIIITTPPPCSEDPNQFSCYKSGKGVCVERHLVCNFVADCPNGEDESVPVCVANPTSFSGKVLEESGWFAKSTKKYGWQLVNASDIPRKCVRACPTTDMDGSGTYAAADASLATFFGEHALLRMSSPISTTGPQCTLAFGFVLTEAGPNAFGTMTLSIIWPSPQNDTTSREMKERLWAIETRYNQNYWQKVEIFLGRQSKPFFLEFEAVSPPDNFLPAAAAVDGIEFKDCQEAEPLESCKSGLFHCDGNSACIDPRYLCDFADHCGDGVANDVTSSSDEAQAMCSNLYVARCSFDPPAVTCRDWVSVEIDKFDFDSVSWRIVDARPLSGFPLVDHTTGTNVGHMLYVARLTNVSPNKRSARYKTSQRVVVSKAQDDCQLRFWLYHHTTLGEFTNFYVLARTSYKPIKEIYLANFTDTTGNAWLRQEVKIETKAVGDSQPFEIVFLGEVEGRGTAGGLAIDDISMTPYCHLTNALLPGQETVTTTTRAPSCSDQSGFFKCASGDECYFLSQHCNFVNDCQDGSDESSCSSSCNFDGNSTDLCNWENACRENGKVECDPSLNMYWMWFKKGEKNDPPSDYTSNGQGGGYLLARSFSFNDKAVLQSTVFQHVSPNCYMRFWYWAYLSFDSTSHSALNVYIKPSRYEKQLLFHAEASLTPEWFPANVTLYSKSSFEVLFEAVRGIYGDIAIDGIEFVNCSPDTPAASCADPNDFLCDDGSRCIPEARKCDFATDCRDGSDEREDKCVAYRAPGSCTFENPQWQSACWLEETPDGDRLEWAPVAAAKIAQGPEVDHTLQLGTGHVLYVDVLSEDVGSFAKAIITTKSIFPANPTGNCLFRFYYYFYRSKKSFGSGQIKIFTIGAKTNTSIIHGKLSLATLQPGTNTNSGPNNPWSLVNFVIARIEPFSIQMIAEVDDSPSSVIAIDDVSLSEGCRTGKDKPIAANSTYCSDDEVFCESELFCVTAEWVCDGWCDCPPQKQTKGVCVDEAHCSPEEYTTTTPVGPVTGKTDQPPTTGPETTTEQTPDTTSNESTTEEEQTTAKPNGGDDLGLILGIVFGVVGAVALTLIGAFVYLKCFQNRGLPPVALPGTAPGDGIANPIYGQTAPDDDQ